jgi:hypothetical protein
MVQLHADCRALMDLAEPILSVDQRMRVFVLDSCLCWGDGRHDFLAPSRVARFVGVGQLGSGYIPRSSRRRSQPGTGPMKGRRRAPVRAPINSADGCSETQRNLTMVIFQWLDDILCRHLASRVAVGATIRVVVRPYDPRPISATTVRPRLPDNDDPHFSRQRCGPKIPPIEPAAIT